jgi:hypothetical protein
LALATAQHRAAEETFRPPKSRAHHGVALEWRQVAQVDLTRARLQTIERRAT